MNASLRTFLYLCVCVTVRLAIALVTSLLHAQGAAAVPYFAVAVGFIWTALHRPPRGIFGGEAWWDQLRAFHAAIWACAAVCVLLNVCYAASVLLVIDVCVGGVLWGYSGSQQDDLLEPIFANDIII